MESGYSGKDREARQPERQTKREQRQERMSERAGAKELTSTLSSAAQRLHYGASLRDLSPEEARELAATVGNQTVLRLLHGGSGVPLAPAPPGRSEEESLPETVIGIRWPALCAPPGLARDGPLPGAVFSLAGFRPMGQYAGSGVIPDG